MDDYELRDQRDLDALALEYQREYRGARGNLDLSYFVNNPFLNSPHSILSLGFEEEFANFRLG